MSEGAEGRSVLWGDYYWSRDACNKAMREEVAKKHTQILFNMSRETFALAPGPADPDVEAVMSDGFCGQGCRDPEWEDKANNLVCWSREGDTNKPPP